MHKNIVELYYAALKQMSVFYKSPETVKPHLTKPTMSPSVIFQLTVTVTEMTK